MVRARTHVIGSFLDTTKFGIAIEPKIYRVQSTSSERACVLHNLFAPQPSHVSSRGSPGRRSALSAADRRHTVSRRPATDYA